MNATITSPDEPYLILKKHTITELMTEVNLHIRSGWSLAGGVATGRVSARHAEEERLYFFQALIYDKPFC